MNPTVGKDIKDWPARFYVMPYADSQFIKVSLSGQYTNFRGFQYGVSVWYGDEKLVPLLAKLQRAQIRKFHVEIGLCGLSQIVQNERKMHFSDRNLKKGQPHQQIWERISQHLDEYGMPWAKKQLAPEVVAETIVNRFSHPAMTISFALQNGDFDFAQRRLELLVQNRYQRIETWRRHRPTYSQQELEDAVDARHLSEPSLPNPRFIDGEFMRLAQRAIEEKSVDWLLSEE